jgi:hypothetical protein
MKFSFSGHAVDRYIQYYTEDNARSAEERAAARSEAYRVLEEASESAIKLKEKTPPGDTQWILEQLGGVLCVTKPKKEKPNELICVTVLPNQSRCGWMISEEAARIEAKIEELQEHRKALAEEEAKLEGISKAPTPNLPSKAAQVAIHSHAQTRLAELKAEAAVLSWEATVLGQQLKTIRTSISSARTTDNIKDALRVALRFIKSLPPEQAEGVLERIAAYGPGFIQPGFYDLLTCDERERGRTGHEDDA